MSSNVEPQPPGPTHCVYCGAEWKPHTATCWMCHQPPAGDVVKAAVRDADGLGINAASAAPRKPFQYGLSSLLLITTLVCIIGSITRMAPGLGISIMVLAVPALINTIVAASQRASSGKPMSAGRKVLWFTLALLVAFLVTGLAALAGAVAILAVCSGTMGSRVQGDALLALVAAAVAAISVIVGFFVIYFRVQRRRRKRGQQASGEG